MRKGRIIIVKPIIPPAFKEKNEDIMSWYFLILFPIAVAIFCFIWIQY